MKAVNKKTASPCGLDALMRIAALGVRNTMNQEYFEKLIVFLESLPAIDLPAGRKSIGYGNFESENWWVKFKLNLSHPLTWRHVQELRHVLNYFP